MTVTTSRPTSRFGWVPAAAGWIIGVIATLSLLSSVSPLLRHLIKVPREFINDYLFNFPDTSFAWAFVLGLLAAALVAGVFLGSTAWWILLCYMVAASVWNVIDLLTGDESAAVDAGEVMGLVFHVASIGLLLLAYREFWARVRRGALLKAAATLFASSATPSGGIPPRPGPGPEEPSLRLTWTRAPMSRPAAMAARPRARTSLARSIE